MGFVRMRLLFCKGKAGMVQAPESQLVMVRVRVKRILPSVATVSILELLKISKCWNESIAKKEGWLLAGKKASSFNCAGSPMIMLALSTEAETDMVFWPTLICAYRSNKKTK